MILGPPSGGCVTAGLGPRKLAPKLASAAARTLPDTPSKRG